MTAVLLLAAAVALLNVGITAGMTAWGRRKTSWEAGLQALGMLLHLLIILAVALALWFVHRRLAPVAAFGFTAAVLQTIGLVWMSLRQQSK